MTMNVVFTGWAIDAKGEKITRDRLCKAAAEAGFWVENKITSCTHYLVASRTDTVKAQRAKDLGVTVLDYPHFITLLRDEGVTL